MAGIGPVPFCGMLLADMGADVLRIDRVEPAADLGVSLGSDPRFNVTGRGKRSVAVDLKHPAGPQAVLELTRGADVLIEGFRPGTMERLGLSPKECHAVNPRLVYARMTGWGQTGPAARSAGHDINYIALTGALHAIGTAEMPLPPLNLVGDYGGGAMFLAFGIASALLARHRTGEGEVIDAAMVDGAAYLMAPTYAMVAHGIWKDERASNFLDGSAPWYSTYRTRDGRFMAVGAIESRFYAEFVKGLGLAEESLPTRQDRCSWPTLRERFATAFLERTRDEWSTVFAAVDACVSPVLSLTEAPAHAHTHARETFFSRDNVVQPAPAPRFSRNSAGVPKPASRVGADGEATLREWGMPTERVNELARLGAIGSKTAEAS